MEVIKYKIEYEPHTYLQLKKIPKNMASRIKKAIEERLTYLPNDYGKELIREWKGHRRLRVGNYRIIYKIFEDKVLVLIVEIDHRKDAYSM